MEVRGARLIIFKMVVAMYDCALVGLRSRWMTFARERSQYGSRVEETKSEAVMSFSSRATMCGEGRSSLGLRKSIAIVEYNAPRML